MCLKETPIKHIMKSLMLLMNSTTSLKRPNGTDSARKNVLEMRETLPAGNLAKHRREESSLNHVAHHLQLRIVPTTKQDILPFRKRKTWTSQCFKIRQIHRNFCGLNPDDK